jgi:hypothetical protein
MKAIHGGKAKNDKIDSQKIAALLRGGMLPQAYVYPAEMRATRDLFRRRTHLMRKRLVTPFRIGLSVMGSMATQQVHTIADLHRQFNEWWELGTDYNAFYKQLDKSAAPEFFRASLSDIMSQLTMKVLGFEAGAAFSEFGRLILQDGTSFALHRALAERFPGRFNAVIPAAVELHCTLDLLQDAPIQTTTLRAGGGMAHRG